jgi:uncharacterized membrane protein YfcA
MNLLEIANIEWFLILLPIVAFMYAAVGHGGASGYLALMALFSFAPEHMKSTALLLNLFVAAISFISYARKGFFNGKLFLAFSISSIPFAFIGGMIEVDASIYKKVLSVLLVISILRMLNVFGNVKEGAEVAKVNIWQGLVLGCAIGFFSGLIGIGGGIILSPVLLLMNWGKMKETAAVSALFIWVNSAAGISGQLYSGVTVDSEVFILVAIAIVGGLLGGYFGSNKFNNNGLTYLLAFVLTLAGVKLMLT